MRFDHRLQMPKASWRVALARIDVERGLREQKLNHRERLHVLRAATVPAINSAQRIERDRECLDHEFRMGHEPPGKHRSH